MLKQKLQTQSGVADLRKDDGIKITSERKKAEALKQFFKSFLIAEESGTLPDPPQYTLSDERTESEITEKVRKLLASLQTNKAAGPDEVNPAALTELVDV